MSKKSVNVKSSIVVLLLIAILLIASSYAWFTANQTVAVSSLDVNVQAQNGLQISVDGSKWKSIIQKEDLTGVTTTYATSVNQLPSELEPVSTGVEIDGTTGFLNMYYGTVGTDTDGDYTLTAAKDTEVSGTTGKFITFDLFFKVDKDTPIYLTPNSSVTYTGEKDQGLQNASRVAFLVEGNTAAGSSISTIQGLNGATTSTTYLWEPNCNIHTAAAVSHAYDTYKITTFEDDENPISYDGIKAVIASEDAMKLGDATAAKHATLFNTVTPSYSTEEGFVANQSLFTLQKGITKVRTYMWIEGQDVDCENQASGANISFQLQITSNNA